MIIDDFNIIGVTAFPSKTNTPLVVDADAPLTGSIAAQLFQPVGGRYAQVSKGDCIVDHAKLAQGDLMDIRR